MFSPRKHQKTAPSHTPTRSFKPFTCRRTRSARYWAVVAMIGMTLTSNLGLGVVAPLQAQTQPVGAGFTLDAGDLRFIFHQIEVAQAHAATRTAANPCG